MLKNKKVNRDLVYANWTDGEFVKAKWRLSKAPPVMLQVAAAAAAQKLENTFAGFFVIVDPGKKMIQPVGWGLANRKQYSLKAGDDWKLD